MIDIIMGLAAVAGLVMMTAVVAGVVMSANNTNSQRNVREYERQYEPPYHQEQAPEPEGFAAPNPYCPAALCTAAREQRLTGWRREQAEQQAEREAYINEPAHETDYDPRWNQPAQEPEVLPIEQPIEVPNWPVRVGRK